jgi:hypothetical protein
MQSENMYMLLLLVLQHTCSRSYVNGVKTARHMSLNKAHVSEQPHDKQLLNAYI